MFTLTNAVVGSLSLGLRGCVGSCPVVLRSSGPLAKAVGETCEHIRGLAGTGGGGGRDPFEEAADIRFRAASDGT